MHFSLIIPTRNRCSSLRLVIQELERQRYPRERFEVVVVDDGSSDDTTPMLHEQSTSYSLTALRHERNQGTSAARNRAIRAAKGSYCLFLDDDVLASPDLLSLHEEAHRGQVRSVVRGPVINVPKPPESAPSQLWRHYSMNYFCTSNASVRREHLFEAGLFDESLERYEDADLGQRLKRMGLKRLFSSKAWVHHLKPPVPREQAVATRRADGRSAAQLLKRNPSFRMLLRSGLHPVNYARSELLSLPGLERIPGLKSLVEAQRLDREYLRAGREELRR